MKAIAHPCVRTNSLLNKYQLGIYSTHLDRIRNRLQPQALVSLNRGSPGALDKQGKHLLWVFNIQMVLSRKYLLAHAEVVKSGYIDHEYVARE